MEFIEQEGGGRYGVRLKDENEMALAKILIFLNFNFLNHKKLHVSKNFMGPGPQRHDATERKMQLC